MICVQKSKNYGCMGYILFYAGVVIAPVIIISVFGLNQDILPAYVVCLFIGFFVGGYLGLSLFSDVKHDKLAHVLCVSTIFVVAFVSLALYIFLFDVDLYDDTKTNGYTSNSMSTSRPATTATTRTTAQPTKKSTTTSTTNWATYYKANYPMTWGYISKYADDPTTYVQFYQKVWGDLQKYHGDGIPFETLTRYEQSLVHYPSIGQYIYFAVGERTYHSTRDCYTLLRSETSLRMAKYAYLYDPCSKCVGE